MLNPHPQSFLCAKTAITLYADADPGSPLLLLCISQGMQQPILQALTSLCPENNLSLSLAFVEVSDWNSQLSPWKADPVFARSPGFAGQADPFIQILTSQILPAIQDHLAAQPETVGIGGYSLAGMFALYCLYVTDCFSFALCASGSFWYPGFVDYAQSHSFMRKPLCLYFSLGSKEAKTNNPWMRQVETCTRALADFYTRQKIDTIFVSNPGGHFQDPPLRVAKGILWIMEQLNQNKDKKEESKRS